ncbi:hypothetical protein BEWA_050260 [Theileria equi strain WA]|uniref:Uncharacterized protein n=1 Tax=Theileria equi strain WA TaxID=1537102 RepID=L1LBK5_THEEQ|nr:hypothetical protein BEWA_050260 [Theileria equi strain WA]EKX72558.1 hypothetical protein BEWA_050260 [Theileria equi strain WA]|eukprot:XP_004832010.1 hypothetical protein BEWA_050260 [Theileria equi strain WA]
MSTEGIDIRKKCPEGKSLGTCQDDSQVEAKRGRLRDVDNRETGYKYCRHKYDSHKLWIDQVTYGNQPIKIEGNDGKKSISFSDIHPKVWEVTTYYSFEHDNGKTTIKVPLALRVQSNTSEYNCGNYCWYENLGRDNLTWRSISSTQNFPEDDPGKGGNEFKNKLDELACKLHKLHIVDIYKISNYKCACGKANVTVTPITDKNDGDLKGYIKYEYSYASDKNFVRYKRVNIKDGDDDKLLTLNKDTPKLSAYYWDQDEKRRKKPLLMEVHVQRFSGIPVIVSNNGDSDSKQWTMIMPESGELQLKGDELKKALHKQSANFSDL